MHLENSNLPVPVNDFDDPGVVDTRIIKGTFLKFTTNGTWVCNDGLPPPKRRQLPLASGIPRGR